MPHSGRTCQITLPPFMASGGQSACQAPCPTSTSRLEIPRVKKTRVGIPSQPRRPGTARMNEPPGVADRLREPHQRQSHRTPRLPGPRPPDPPHAPTPSTYPSRGASLPSRTVFRQSPRAIRGIRCVTHPKGNPKSTQQKRPARIYYSAPPPTYAK